MQFFLRLFLFLETQHKTISFPTILEHVLRAWTFRVTEHVSFFGQDKTRRCHLLNSARHYSLLVRNPVYMDSQWTSRTG